MSNILLIPTEENVDRLFELYMNARCKRNMGFAVSEREVRRKADAYQKLYKQKMNLDIFGVIR